MMRFKAPLLLAIVLCNAAINGDDDGGVLTYLRYDPFVRPLNMTNKVFVEAECSDGIENKKSCEIELESVSSNGVKTEKECKVDFLTENDHLGINFFRPVAVVGNNSVIVSYHDIISSKGSPFKEEGFRVYSIIDMNICKFHEARIFYKYTSHEQLLTPETPILPYNDGTFDVFVSGKDVCNGGRCKLTFNMKGEKIKAPLSYLPADLATNDVRMFPLTQTSSPKNFFVTIQNRQNKTYQKLLYTTPDGSVQDVINFEIDGQPLNIDSFNDRFTVCYQVKADSTKVHCRQFNSENKQTLEATLSLESDERQIRIHNVPEGGFLQLTTQCAGCTKHNDYRLTRILPNGQPGKVTKIEKLNCVKPHNRSADVSEIFFTEDNLVCIRKSCDGFEHLDVVKKCFKKEEVL